MTLWTFTQLSYHLLIKIPFIVQNQIFKPEKCLNILCLVKMLADIVKYSLGRILKG